MLTTLAQAQLARGIDAKATLARSRDLLVARARKFDDPSARATFLDALEANRRTRALVREHLGEEVDG